MSVMDSGLISTCYSNLGSKLRESYVGSIINDELLQKTIFDHAGFLDHALKNINVTIEANPNLVCHGNLSNIISRLAAATHSSLITINIKDQREKLELSLQLEGGRLLDPASVLIQGIWAD